MKVENIGVALAGIVNLGCICGLAYIGLKRNNDCYKAECKLMNAELENIAYEVKNEAQEAKIKVLEAKVAELKKNGVAEEEA